MAVAINGDIYISKKGELVYPNFPGSNPEFYKRNPKDPFHFILLKPHEYSEELKEKLKSKETGIKEKVD